MKKKMILLAVSILCVIGFAAQTTIAFYTRTGTSKSVVTASNLKIETLVMEEKHGSLHQASLTTPAMPKSQFSRIVTIKNIGNEEAWIRVKVDIVEDGISTLIKDSVLVTLVSENYNDWKYQDGYWYYNTKLAPGETTNTLFEGVVFSENIDNSRVGKQLTLDVKGEATQCKYNGSTALEAAGWPSN